MEFFDTVQLGDAATRRRTGDGYLVAMARAARTGIQIYAGREVGRPDLDTVRVYRPEDEVFARDSLASYAHKPMTNDHPSEAVTAENWKSHAVGFVGDEIARDGEHVRIPLMLADAAAIAALDAGKAELSAGYTATLDWTSGTAPDGSAYDAVQRDIRINHVALVDAGRAGPTARVSDGGKQASTQPKQERSMTDATKTTLVVDGLTVSVEPRDAQIVQRHLDKLTADIADLRKRLADAEKEKEDAKEEWEKEDAKKDAALDALKAKVVDGPALDALVQARGDLIATARAIVPDVEHKGLSDAAIRRAVVVKKLGDKAIEGKSEAYIDARFDILAESAGRPDPIRDAARGTGGKPGAANDPFADRQQAYADMLNHNANAYKRKEA